jgi:hypothetical protein
MKKVLLMAAIAGIVSPLFALSGSVILNRAVSRHITILLENAGATAMVADGIKSYSIKALPCVTDPMGPDSNVCVMFDRNANNKPLTLMGGDAIKLNAAIYNQDTGASEMDLIMRVQGVDCVDLENCTVTNLHQ